MFYSDGKTRNGTGARGKRALSMLLAILALFSLAGAPTCRAATDENGREVFCGHVAHTHTDACYTERSVLVCGLEECEGHRHGDACYTERSVLVCGLEECEGHTHGDACYTERSVLVCTNDDPEHVHTADCYTTERVLACGLAERAGHTHTPDCYGAERVLSCTLEEREGHTHTDACRTVERVLVCGLEEHEHTLECYADRSAVETRADCRASVSGAMLTGRWDLDLVAIARTQIGYRESSRNYIVRNGVVHRYTRYGDWMDSSELVVYGPWCASFASFCIYYANIKGVPLSSNCSAWVKKLADAGMYYDYGEIEPRAGDLVFLYSGWEKDAEQRRATHVGIVAEVRQDSLVTIEGNVGSVVSWREYTSMDTVLGFARLPDNPDYISVESADGAVRVSGLLPADAELEVRRVALEEFSGCGLPERELVCAFELRLVSDGREFKPSHAVTVELRPGTLPERKLHVIHIRLDEKGEEKENWPVEGLSVGEDSLSYIAFSLSRCVVLADWPDAEQTAG